MERSLNWFDQTNNIHVAKSTRPSNRRDKHLVYCMHVNRHATKIIDYQIIYTPAKGKFLSKGTTAVILRKYHLHFYKKNVIRSDFTQYMFHDEEYNGRDKPFAIFLKAYPQPPFLKRAEENHYLDSKQRLVNQTSRYLVRADHTSVQH